MYFRFEFRAIGTLWVIDIEQSSLEENTKDFEEKIKKIKDSVMQRINEFDKTYSRFRADSLVSKMSKTAGEHFLPDDAKKMFNLYKKLYDITDGLVTPLMGKILSDTGYDSSYSLKPKTHIDLAKKWQESFVYEHPRLNLKEPVHFDFGAIGKGYLVDIVSTILEDCGIKNYTVDAGGDIVYRNERGKTLRVGLENPENTAQAVGVADIINKSICGSALNRRAWGKYTHVINPKTIESPKEILAVWVVADDAITADGLATALFFTSPEKLKEHFDFDFAILNANHSARMSPSFPGHFFSE